VILNKIFNLCQEPNYIKWRIRLSFTLAATILRLYDENMRKIIILIVLIVTACSSQPGPKDVVFDFIRAVKMSDSLAVVQILDIDAYIKMRMTEMSPEDSAQVLAEENVKTIQSLLGNGETRRYWSKPEMRILVNKARINENDADVDMSFMDKQTGSLVYSKVLLKKQDDDSWRIVYFKQ
jgi:hypothetical protein